MKQGSLSRPVQRAGLALAALLGSVVSLEASAAPAPQAVHVSDHGHASGVFVFPAHTG